MELIIEYCSPCNTKVFKINGIEMNDLESFGEYEEDSCPEDCQGYDCHNKHFICNKEKILKTLEKNNIVLTENEINELIIKLEKMFDVGDCGNCV